MAYRIVQPKVLASTNPDTYDNLIIQQAQNATNATNATNAIVNNDGSFSGFTQTANNVLNVGNEIITKKILMWSGNAYPTDRNPLDISYLNFNSGDLMEIKVEWNQAYYDTTFLTMEYPASGGYNDKNVCVIQIQQAPPALLVHQGKLSVYDSSKTIKFSSMRFLTISSEGISWVAEGNLPSITAIYKIIQ